MSYQLYVWFWGTKAFKALIGIVVLWAFRHTQGLIKEVVVHDIGEVTTNALTERELSSIQADTGFFLNTFFEKEEFLKTESNRLLSLTLGLVDRNKGRDLEKPLRGFSQNLASLMQQCVAVNDLLRHLKVSDREILNQINRLEEIISERLINLTIIDEDTGIMEQLASLVASYHTSLLEIGKLRAESWPSHYYADMTATDDKILAALDELILRCRTLTASDFVVAELGRGLISALEEFRRNDKDLHTVMFDLNIRIKTLEASKKQIGTVMVALDRDVAQVIRKVDAKIGRRLRVTGIASLLLAALLVVALGLLTTHFFKKIIKSPIETIREGIEGLQSGDLETRIRLGRTDEWSVIEKALNTMAEKLSESYAALRFKEHIIESAAISIATAGLDGKMTYINPSFLEAWRVEDPAEILGKSLTEFWTAEGLSDEIKTGLRGKGIWRDERANCQLSLQIQRCYP